MKKKNKNYQLSNVSPVLCFYSATPYFEGYIYKGDLHYKKEVAAGFTTMCRSGCVTSPPPACFTNSAGERKVPWHTHIILTSSPFPYRYRIPSIFLPLGPSPFVKTQGISSMAFILCCLSLFPEGLGFLYMFSMSALEILDAFSGVNDPEEPKAVSRLVRWSCNNWLPAGLLASPQLLDPVMLTENYKEKQVAVFLLLFHPLHLLWNLIDFKFTRWT